MEMKDIELPLGNIPSGMSQLDLISTLYSFTLCVIMSFILRAFYIKRSFSLTGKTHIASILPILSIIVFLVIIVVKSSLALSLGLVGALSIVRFRTPIKEPEELVYLFLAIAIGLGYGAGQTLITTILVSLILIIIFIWLSNRNLSKTSEFNLVIKWGSNNVSFEEIIKQISDSVESLKLVRLDKNNEDNTAVLLITPKIEFSINLLLEKITEIDNKANVTFYESKTNW